MTRRTFNQRDAGFALVLVLVGIALLALILETVLLLSTKSVQLVSNEVIRSQLECAARAGITEGIVSLLDQNPNPGWRLDGTPRDVVFEGKRVTISIASEAGKININNASLSLIANLFAAGGLDQTDAQIMADRVLDWREPGMLKHLNGAKAADYRAAGLPYGPRLGPFQSIDELNLVMGMTPELYERLAPATTIYNLYFVPQLQDAPPMVLRASGLDNAYIQAIMAARARGEVAPNDGANRLKARGAIPGVPSAAFTITATDRAQGQILTRSETIRFTGNPNDPFWILAWR